MTGHIRKAGTLGFRHRWALYGVGIGVWLSGGVWLLYHYFLVRPGEFGPETNPLEPWWLRVHGAFAFAALWFFGLLWAVHITKLWPHKRRRWSGGLLTAVFTVLIVSGYLLYYVGDERVRPVLSGIHWSVGLGTPLLFAWHRLTRRKRRTVSAAPPHSARAKP